MFYSWEGRARKIREEFLMQQNTWSFVGRNGVGAPLSCEINIKSPQSVRRSNKNVERKPPYRFSRAAWKANLKERNDS